MQETRLIRLNGLEKQELNICPERLLLAGYTARKRSDLQRHIDELATIGIPAPVQIPEIYIGSLMQVNGKIPAGHGLSSGEVEYVLVVTPNEIMVGVGSDHTDRTLQRTSAVAAKQVFPKVIGPYVRPLKDLQAEWDTLFLRSWVTRDGERQLYQDASLSTLMTPSQLLSLIPSESGEECFVIYSGTIPILGETPSSGLCSFEGELLDRTGRIICFCTYEYVASLEESSEGVRDG